MEEPEDDVSLYYMVQITSKFTIILKFLQGSREFSNESWDFLSGTREMHK